MSVQLASVHSRRPQVTANQRDTLWDTYTNILGFSVMGIWQPGSDGTDINALCRYAATAWCWPCFIHSMPASVQVTRAGNRQ